MSQPRALALEGTATYAGDLSTGAVFLLTVTRGDAHVAAGATVTLTVQTADADTTRLLGDHQAPTLLRLRFSRLRDDEPYNTLPITGFVDAAMTSWQLDVVDTG